TTAPDFGFPTVWGRDPYIHFERDREGRIVSVLQRREQAVLPSEGEGDVGLFAMTGGAYAGELPRYAQECVPSLGTRERNFLPFIPWLAGRGGVVMTVPATDRTEAMGVNTPEDLASVAAELARRTAG